MRFVFCGFSCYGFSVSTKNDNLLLDFYFDKKNLLEHFSNDLEKTEIVIPVEFPRIHEIQTFSEYLPFLQNIDRITSLEDIEKLSTKTKQRIMFPLDLI